MLLSYKFNFFHLDCILRVTQYSCTACLRFLCFETLICHLWTSTFLYSFCLTYLSTTQFNSIMFNWISLIIWFLLVSVKYFGSTIFNSATFSIPLHSSVKSCITFKLFPYSNKKCNYFNSPPIALNFALPKLVSLIFVIFKKTGIN